MVELVKGLMKGRAYRAARSTKPLEDAERALAAAEEGARDDFATATTGMAVEDITAGMNAHAEQTRAARQALAEARAFTPPSAEVRNFTEAWDGLPPEQRRSVLRSALGVVVVRRGRGIDLDRVRVVEAGITIPTDERIDFDRLEGVIAGP